MIKFFVSGVDLTLNKPTSNGFVGYFNKFKQAERAVLLLVARTKIHDYYVIEEIGNTLFKEESHEWWYRYDSILKRYVACFKPTNLEEYVHWA